MIKRPIMIACAGFLVVLVALLLLFLSDEEVVDKNLAGSTTEKDNEAESSQQDLIIKKDDKLKVVSVNLTKKYSGKVVVNEVNIKVSSGEIIGLLGLNNPMHLKQFLLKMLKLILKKKLNLLMKE